MLRQEKLWKSKWDPIWSGYHWQVRRRLLWIESVSYQPSTMVEHHLIPSTHCYQTIFQNTVINDSIHPYLHTDTTALLPHMVACYTHDELQLEHSDELHPLGHSPASSDDYRTISTGFDPSMHCVFTCRDWPDELVASIRAVPLFESRVGHVPPSPSHCPPSCLNLPLFCFIAILTDIPNASKQIKSHSLMCNFETWTIFMVFYMYTYKETPSPIPLPGQRSCDRWPANPEHWVVYRLWILVLHLSPSVLNYSRDCQLHLS